MDALHRLDIPHNPGGSQGCRVGSVGGLAITAREFSFPAICGTIRATHQIPEGAQVILDADAGIVTWI